ncbi:MAG: recombinase family protein [candidate division Zixibacteria bacterium]|nr:recombinase family protein [candidate division Zixibacteria bacterium]
MKSAVKTSIGFKPAVGYLRRSTDRQEQSIGDQKKAIELYALTAGYELVDFYIDDAISGASSEGRASFLRLIEDSKHKDCPFQYVLVYDVKRFGRVDNDEAGFYRYQLRRKGIEIVYVSEGFNGNDTDDLLRPVKQWQARQELKDLSKVVIRGLLTRSEGGWWMGGVPPYGYDLAYYNSSGDFICIVRFMEDGSRNIYDAEGSLQRAIPKGESLALSRKDRCRLVSSSPDRVEVIKNIFDLYLIEGLGYKGISHRLNRNNIPSPRCKTKGNGKLSQWASTTIMAMLKNPAYTGDMTWNKKSYAKFHRISDKRALAMKNLPGNEVYHNSEEDWIVHKDAHPELIARDRYNRVQAKIRATAKHGYANSYRCGNGAKSPYLLVGLIKCMNCGHNWTGHKAIKGRKRLDGSNAAYYSYTCNGYISKGNSVCNLNAIPKDAIEVWVMEVIGQMLIEYFDSDNLKILRRMVEQEINALIPDIGAELDQIEHRLAEITKAITNLIDNISDVNREFVDKRITELKREMIELEKRKAQCESAGEKRLETERIIDEAMAMAGDFKQVLAEGSVEEKRLFIRAFLTGINLDPRTGEGEARFILLPGLNKLWQPQNLPELYENPAKQAQKNPEIREMSSRLVVAAQGLEPRTRGL